MPPDEKELLDKSVALSEENNKMLHSMMRSMRIQRIMTIIYWLFIIGSAAGAYYFIQPYLGDLINVYGGGANSILNGYQ